jgi:hypothetical protein
MGWHILRHNAHAWEIQYNTVLYIHLRYQPIIKCWFDGIRFSSTGTSHTKPVVAVIPMPWILAMQWIHPLHTGHNHSYPADETGRTVWDLRTGIPNCQQHVARSRNLTLTQLNWTVKAPWKIDWKWKWGASQSTNWKGPFTSCQSRPGEGSIVGEKNADATMAMSERRFTWDFWHICQRNNRDARLCDIYTIQVY